MTLAAPIPPPPPLAPPKGRIRPITSDEFIRMIGAGFFAGERVELIEGRIVRKLPVVQHNRHVYSTTMMYRALDRVFPVARYWVRNQAGLRATRLSTPEPDIAVLNHPPTRDGTVPDAPDVLLVVEVSDSTLASDRRRKVGLYAAAGIPEAVLMNVPGGQLEVHRDPVPDPSARSGHRYATVLVLRPGDTFSPLAAPMATIAVADLF